MKKHSVLVGPSKSVLVYTLHSLEKTIEKQVRTNIGLADTLMPSSFIYFIYIGGTGPCDSSKIIFGIHVYS